MKRIELIINRSIEDDFVELISKKHNPFEYTRIPEVHGVGTTDEKHGDAIWPEENIIYIIYCDQEEFEQITEVVRELKRYFPAEGVKLFASESDEIV